MLLIAFLAAAATAAVSDGPASAKTQAFSAALLGTGSTPALIPGSLTETAELEKLAICPEVLNGPGGMIAAPLAPAPARCRQPRGNPLRPQTPIFRACFRSLAARWQVGGWCFAGLTA